MKVLYSVSFGGVDASAPCPAQGKCAELFDHRVLFTDQPDKAGEGWTKVVPCESSFGEAHKLTRAFKMGPHRLFPDAELAAYSDLNLQLDPAVFSEDLRTFMGTPAAVVGVKPQVPPNHRPRVELQSMSGIADTAHRPYNIENMKKQLDSYENALAMGHLEIQTYCGGFILWKKGSHQFADRWYAELLKWDQWRDQISLAMLVHLHGYEVMELTLKTYVRTPHEYSRQNSEDKYNELGFDYHWKTVDAEVAMGGGAYLEGLYHALSPLGFPGEENEIVLDIGCGDGVASSIIFDRGYDVIGVEPVDGARAVAEQKVPGAMFYSDMEALLDDEEFGPPWPTHMVLLDVLEHIEVQHLHSLRKLWNLCIGKLIIKVPHYGMDRWAIRDCRPEWIADLFGAVPVCLGVNPWGVTYQLEHIK